MKLTQFQNDFTAKRNPHCFFHSSWTSDKLKNKETKWPSTAPWRLLFDTTRCFRKFAWSILHMHFQQYLLLLQWHLWGSAHLSGVLKN
jgi:hypothetical protein